MQWWFVGAAALAGCFIAVQAAANSAFRASLDSPWYAAFFFNYRNNGVRCIVPDLPSPSPSHRWNPSHHSMVELDRGSPRRRLCAFWHPSCTTPWYRDFPCSSRRRPTNVRVTHRSFRPDGHQPALYLIRKTSRRRFGRQWRTSSEISLRRNSEPTY